MIEKDLDNGLRTREYPNRFVIQGTTVEAVQALTFLNRKGFDALKVRFNLSDEWTSYKAHLLSDGKIISIEFFKNE